MASFLGGIARVFAGVAAVAAGIALEGATFGLATPVSGLLISAGAGLALSGLGTIIDGAGTGRGGSVTSERNPIKPWDVIEGQTKHGGTCVYINTWPPPGTYGSMSGPFGLFGIGSQQDNPNTFLDMVFVLCAHPVQAITSVLFDGSPIALDPTAAYYGKGGGPGKITPTLGATSYNPTQTNKQTTSITRSGGVVTVVCPFDIPALDVGDPILLQDENGANGLKAYNLQGIFIVQTISRVPGTSITFTVLSGGLNITIPNSSYTNAGWVTTQWPSYGRDVYVEFMLGDQVLGQTFNGLIGGTPFQGGNLGAGPNIPSNQLGIPADGINPWTVYCSLQQKTAVFVRLYYEQKYFASGIPQISFLVQGKRDIYDPRLGNLTGLKAVSLYSGGSGGYKFGDTVTLTQSGAANGEVHITGVDGSGNPTSWQITATGYGYSLGVTGSSGGSGSGAQWSVNTLGGISSGVATVGITAGGQSYNKFDILMVGGQYGNGTLCFLEVTSVGSGGSVTGVSVLTSGYGYNTGAGVPVTITGNAGFDATAGNMASGNAAGSGTGCTIDILTLTNTHSGSPVESTAVYSTNSALIIADYLADPIWGYSATYVVESSVTSPYNNIGITALTVAANVCDQQVTLAAGGTESCYTCNGRFDLSVRRGDTLANLLTSCAGRLLYVGGIYSIQPGYWPPVPSGAWGSSSSPSLSPIAAVSLDLSKIAAGKPVWKPTCKVRELFNAVKGTYINPANKWEPSDFPYYAQDFLHGYSGPAQYGGDINLAMDLGQRRYKDIHLPFTITASMAQRLAKIELLRGRNQGGYGIGSGTFPLNMAGWQLVPLDILDATFPFLSWSGKVLEISSVRFRATKGSEAGDGVVLSTEIDVQETGSSIYDWSVYEDLSPAGYQQAVPPTPNAVEAVPYPWSPAGIAPYNGDAYYLVGTNDVGNFGMVVEYGAETSGVATASLDISGVPPINALDTELGAPAIWAAASSTGGDLASGTYTIGVSAFDSNGVNIPYIDLATVTVGGGQGAASVSVGNAGINYRTGQSAQLIGGGNNCIVTVTGVNSSGGVTGLSILNAGNGYSAITYPTQGGSGTGLTVNIGSLTGTTATGSIQLVIEDWGAGDNGGEVYMALQTISTPQYQYLASIGELLAKNQMHYQATLSPGQTTLTLTSFNASTHGGPDTIFDHLAVVWQPEVHSGPWATIVDAVTSNTVTMGCPSFTSNQWAGYNLSLLAKYDPEVPIPILNMPVASNTASSGGSVTFTIGPNADSVQLPDLTTILSVGDLVTARSNFTFTSSSMTDPNLANGFYPSGASGVETGHLAYVLTGVDAGDVQVIANTANSSGPITPSNPASPSNPATIVNLAGTWAVTPNTGDLVVICKPANAPEQATHPMQNPNAAGGVATLATVNPQNLLGQTWLFTVKTEDKKGNSAPLFVAPRRDLYFFGAGGTRYLSSYSGSPPPSSNTYTMNNWDGLVVADCSNNDVVYNALPASDIPNQSFTVSALNNSTYTVTVNAYSGDTFSNGATSWTSGNTVGASFTFKVNG